MNHRTELLNKLPKGSIGAEVGVWHGQFAQEILQRVNPQKLYLIDPWLFDPNYPKAAWGGAQAKSQAEMEKLYRSVCLQFQNDKRVEIFRGQFAELALVIPARSLDWVYIDGNHSYPAVTRDLETAQFLVKDDGFITGDDFGVVGWWDNGVQKAVEDFLTIHPLHQLEILGDQFLIRKNRGNNQKQQCY